MPNYLVTHHATNGAQLEPSVHTMAINAAAGNSAMDVAQGCVTAFETHWATTPTAADVVSGNTAYTHISAAEILDLSLGDLAAAAQVSFTAGLIGAGGLTTPLQCSLAVSLRAGTYANGSPVRGRFFLPAIGTGAITNTGNLEALHPASVAGWAKDYFDDLNLNVGTVSVWSRKLAELQTVVEVKVGRVVDTIRSRNNSMEEAYAIETVATPV